MSNITINKSVFDNGTYTINDDMEILTFNKYLSIWYGDLSDDFTNILNICDDSFNLLNHFREHGFNDDNCIVIVSNLSGDEYLYIWKIDTMSIYDLDCNDKFNNVSNNRGIFCLISSIAYRVLNGYELY